MSIVRHNSAVSDIVLTARNATGMNCAAFALVRNQHWLACEVIDQQGLLLPPGTEQDLALTICSHVVNTGKLIAIPNAAASPIYKHFTSVRNGIRQYLGVPVHDAEGTIFGVLLTADARPVEDIPEESIRIMRFLASMLVSHFDEDPDPHHWPCTHESREYASPLPSQKSSRTPAAASMPPDPRDRILAELGHDLRNPLAAIDAAATMLELAHLEGRSGDLVRVIKRSASRMSGIIHAIIDYSKVQSGASRAKIARSEGVTAALQHIVSELTCAHPGRNIDAHIDELPAIDCDLVRLSQLACNLLSNAIRHGLRRATVYFRAFIEDDELVITCENEGITISPEIAAHIFEPFHGTSRPKDGMGMGLFIAGNIAREHNGQITFRSQEGKTAFTFRMHIRPSM